MSKSGWTPERKARQAELIKTWKPWKHSTGPKTEEGKKGCKMNAKTHGLRSQECRALLSVLQNQKDWLEENKT